MSKVNLGQKFEEVLSRITEIDKHKEDVLKLPRDIRVTESGNIAIQGLGNVAFTKTGFQTFCLKLDLPSGYMNRLIDHDKKTPYEINRDLKVFGENVQRGIETLKEDNKILFRTFRHDNQNKIRAVFSDKYNVIDNLPLLKNLEKYDHDKLETESFNVTSDFLDIRFKMPHLQTSLGKLPEHEVRFGVSDDIVMPAIHFRNSETGKSKIQVSFVVYRLVCTNGMVNTKDHFKVVNKKHMGDYDINEVNDKISHVTSRVEEMFGQYVDHMLNAKNIKVNPTEIFQSVGKRVGVTGKMLDVVNNNWIIEQRAGRTKHDVISAITAGGRDWHTQQKDYSGRLKLEEVAGELLFAKAI